VNCNDSDIITIYFANHRIGFPLRSSSNTEWVKRTSLRTTGIASSERVAMRQCFGENSFGIRLVDHFDSLWDLLGVPNCIRKLRRSVLRDSWQGVRYPNYYGRSLDVHCGSYQHI